MRKRSATRREAGLKKGRQKQWLWPVSRSDATFYRIDPSRGHQVVLKLLDGFEGVLVADGYSAYGAAAKALGGRVCLATAGLTRDGR